MTTIQAWQHIYSNVEKEQSPKGRGGFQTLFYSTSGLTEPEIEEMEGRLLYFPSNGEPVKRLFFTISSGKGVISQIVFVPAPDRYGRGGRYLAHSLIFAPDDLPQFEADPFRVFRQFSFVTTVEAAIKEGNFQTGDIPPVSLSLPGTLAGDVNSASGWSPQELKKLALLALRAKAQAQAREAITVTGPPEQIERALEAAFLAVPTSGRLHCWFDSYFYRCNLVATYFWATGLPEPPVSVKFVHVEAQTKTVQGQVPSQPETAYERWVTNAIESGQLNQIARAHNQAFAVAEWLDGRAYDLSLLEAASAALIDEVFTASPPSVREALRRAVGQKLPDELVERAVERLYEQTPGPALYRQLRQGFELPHLLHILYQSYAAQNFADPPRQELKVLEPLLQQADHEMLRLFVAYWVNPRKQLPNALKWANEAEYRQFGQLALKLNLVEPLQLLVPGRGHAFLDLYLTTGVGNLPELVEALVEAGESNCLTRLSDYVPAQSRKVLQKLNRLVEDEANIPQPFRQAVGRAVAALPPEKGLTGMLKSVWRKLPGG